jgi:hypothetical protein
LSARHRSFTLDEERARLTKDLELTREQQRQVRLLLVEHHDKIQVVLDANPRASRQELGPKIHATSDETHHKIHALLIAHQKELEKATLQREHDGEENRRGARADRRRIYLANAHYDAAGLQQPARRIAR